MKILFLQDDFPPHSLGGAGNVAFTLAKALQGHGHTVAVVTATEQQEDIVESTYEGLRVFTLRHTSHVRWEAYGSLFSPRKSRAIQKILRDFKPDVVHAHNIRRLSYYALKLAKRSGAKVILTAHDSMLFHYGKLGADELQASPVAQLKKYRLRYNPVRNLVIRLYLRYVDRIVAVSGALKEALERNGISGVEVVHNGIDAAAWDVAPAIVEECMQKHGLADTKPILFGGRLSPAKGGEQAVRMLAQVVAHEPKARLVIMGRKNAYAEEMERLAKELGVAQHLVFVGWVADETLRALYHSSSVLLVPSIYTDPLPTVVLEAMACKKPAVVTRYGGAREMVVDGETGYVIDPFDIASSATKLLELIKDSEKAARFGRAGFERVKNEFTLKKQIENTYFV
jgi:glycosyltransferase involved in cell wall biosynthesis